MSRARRAVFVMISSMSTGSRMVAGSPFSTKQRCTLRMSSSMKTRASAAPHEKRTRLPEKKGRIPAPSENAAPKRKDPIELRRETFHGVGMRK